jgi:hypothetical protein
MRRGNANLPRELSKGERQVVDKRRVSFVLSPSYYVVWSRVLLVGKEVTVSSFVNTQAPFSSSSLRRRSFLGEGEH